VLSKSLRALLDRAGMSNSLVIPAIIGSLLALSVPLAAYLLGVVIHGLLEARVGTAAHIPLSNWLPDPERYFAEATPTLVRICVMLAVLLGLLLIGSLMLWNFYRQTQQVAVEFESRMLEQLTDHARRLATQRTLSAQQLDLTDCLDYHLPRVRAMLSRWWRTFPRHAVQLVASLTLALVLAPMLTALSTVGTLLIVLVYRYMDRLGRLRLPVVRERAAQTRSSMARLALQGPLLDSVHDESAVVARFQGYLNHYRRDATNSLSSSAWRIPIVLLLGGTLATVLLLIVAVQILSVESPRTLASLLPFTLCLMAAAVSAVRLDRAFRDTKLVETAANELNRFLNLPVHEMSDENLKNLECLQREIVLEHVTLQDSHGRRLLDDVSVEFQPGKLIGVVATHPLQARALVELLMGYGRPISGRMLLDGQLLTNLKPQSVRQCGHWIASDGALVTGSLLENIGYSGTPLASEHAAEVLAAARLTDCASRLPDETMTLISPGDDRLVGDDAFRLGLARAIVRNAPVQVIDEPPSRATAEAEQETLDAIRALVSSESITIVLPRRLLTLRNCDVVIMLHDHCVADMGSHAELLQRNELYRHMNYLQFNPFRGIIST
jgi:ATP-binding cassette, subfamily B, bacterial